ncbi:hypothetical protein GCM10007304_47190 [Rhodococcoides trifolii]|uniref:Uncharacterized protein n=1 Tax=Rhodococcoides trifolii TaxID=908250 RepID=A0A917LIS3_9NOCA|nr:hypothetical protein [Rhodococcus trifolii]GGG27920.1 hypothetical protein GCM10007304_47190 [Rhodococcus trifolii]
MSKRKWVSGIDMSIANARYMGVVGPVEPWNEDDLVRAVRRLAARGTQTRIALHPTTASHRWSVEPLFDDDVVAPSKELGPGGFASALEELRRADDTRPPFRMAQVGRYIVADIDHGLGDGKLYIDIIHALHEDAESGWARVPETRWAIPKAVIDTFVKHPTRLRDAVRARAALKSLADGGARAESTETTPWTPSVSLAVALATKSSESELTAWRKEHAPRTSGATMSAYLIRRAFDEVGLTVDPNVLLAVNCRRYLSPEATVNGNFITGMSVPMPASRGVEEISGVLSQVYKSGYPLIWMTLAAALARLHKSGEPTVATEAPVSPVMKLMYSDLGRPPKFSNAKWIVGAEGSEAMFTGLLDPAGPDAVTVMSGSVRGERTYSVSFHDNVFPRDLVEKALQLVTEKPLSLLQRS